MRRPDFFSSSDAADRAFDAWLDGETPDTPPSAALTAAVIAARRADTGVAAAVAHIDRAAMLRGVVSAVPASRRRRWQMPRPLSLLQSPAMGFATIALVLLVLAWGIRDVTRDDDAADRMVNYEPVATSGAMAASPFASPVVGDTIVPESFVDRLELTGHTVEIEDDVLRANQFPWLQGQAVTIDGIQSAVFPAGTRIDAQAAFYPVLMETLDITTASGDPWTTARPSYMWFADHIIVVMYDATYSVDEYTALARDMVIEGLMPLRESGATESELLDWTDIVTRLDAEGFDVTVERTAASTQVLTYARTGVLSFGQRVTIDGRTAGIFALPPAMLDRNGNFVEIDPRSVFTDIDRAAIELNKEFLEPIVPEGTWRALLVDNVIIVIDDDTASTDDAADRLATLFDANSQTATPAASPFASPAASSVLIPEWLTNRLEQTGHAIEIGGHALVADQIPGIVGQDLTIDGVQAVAFPLQGEAAAAHAFYPLLPDTLAVTDTSGTLWRDEQPTYIFWADHLIIVLYDAEFEVDTFHRLTQDMQTNDVRVGWENTPIDTGRMDWPDIVSHLGDAGFAVTDQFAAASTRSLTFPIVGIPDFGRLITIDGRTAAVFALPRAELDDKGVVHELAPEDVFAQIDQASLDITQIYGEGPQPAGRWRAFLIGNVIIVIDDDPASTDDAADRVATLFPAPGDTATPVASPVAATVNPVPAWLTDRLEQTGHTIAVGDLDLASDQLPGIPGRAVTLDGSDAAVFVAESATAARDAFNPLLLDTLTLTSNVALPWKRVQPKLVVLVDNVILVSYNDSMGAGSQLRLLEDLQATGAKFSRADAAIDTELFDATDISSILWANAIPHTSIGVATTTEAFGVGPVAGGVWEIDGRQAMVFALPRLFSDSSGTGNGKMITAIDAYVGFDPDTFSAATLDLTPLTSANPWRAVLVRNVIVVVDDDAVAKRLALAFADEQFDDPVSCTVEPLSVDEALVRLRGEAEWTAPASDPAVPWLKGADETMRMFQSCMDERDYLRALALIDPEATYWTVEALTAFGCEIDWDAVRSQLEAMANGTFVEAADTLQLPFDGALPDIAMDLEAGYMVDTWTVLPGIADVSDNAQGVVYQSDNAVGHAWSLRWGEAAGRWQILTFASSVERDPWEATPMTDAVVPVTVPACREQAA